MNAHVVVRFRMPNICEPDDLSREGMTLAQMVKSLIESEGLMGVCEDDFEIVSVDEITPPAPGQEGDGDE